MRIRRIADIRGGARQWARTLIAAALVLALAAAAFNAAYVAAQTPVQSSDETANADEDQADQAPQVAALWGHFTGGASTATTRNHLLKTGIATYGDYDIHDVDGDYIHMSSFMRVLAAMRSQAAAALAIAEAQPIATPAAAQ